MSQQRQAPEDRPTWISIGRIVLVALIGLSIVAIMPINGNPAIRCSNHTPVIGDVGCPEGTLLPVDETATLTPDTAEATVPSSSQPTAIPSTALANTADCLSMSFVDDFESGLSSCWETTNADLVAIGENTVIELDGTDTTAVAEMRDNHRETFCTQFLVRQVGDVESNADSLVFNFRISDDGEYGMLFNFGENYVDFGKNLGSGWEEIMRSDATTIERNREWVEVMIIVTGVYYYVTVNDEMMISASDSSSITDGYLRWSVPATGGIVQIDDVYVNHSC